MAKKSNLRFAQDSAHRAIFDEHGNPRSGVHSALLKAVDVQRPIVLANLRRLRRKHPQATPAELGVKLERDYLAAVTGTGAAVGGSAAIPAVGTLAALGLSMAATVGFLEATALYAASVAELHGIRLEDPDRARTTVMAIMLGEEGTAMLTAFTGQALGRGAAPQQAWGKAINRSLPASAVKALQGSMQQRFLSWMLRKQGSAMLGRMVPFGIGAVVGGAGNLVMGRAIVKSAKLAFGPAPSSMPRDLLALEGGAESAEAPVPEGPEQGETPEQAVEREIEERRSRGPAEG